MNTAQIIASFKRLIGKEPPSLMHDPIYCQAILAARKAAKSHQASREHMAAASVRLHQILRG